MLGIIDFETLSNKSTRYRLGTNVTPVEATGIIHIGVNVHVNNNLLISIDHLCINSKCCFSATFFLSVAYEDTQ